MFSTYSIEKVKDGYYVIDNKTRERVTKKLKRKSQAVDIANELFYYCVTHKPFYNL